MDFLYSTPFKVFITGLILAMITTFTWRSVEIQAVYQSATAAAHSAVADTAHYQSAAQGAASTVLPNTIVDSVHQLSNNVVAATVSYQPTNAFSNVFSYLGVPSPNQRITLTGTAPGSLATLSLAVPKTMGAGTTTSIVGSLVNGAGAPIANQTMTLNVSTGTVSSATVTTNSMGSFSVNFTAPDTITSVRVSASGDHTSVSDTIHVVADVFITSNTPAVVGQAVTLKGKVTDGATGLANQMVTLSADPTVTFANGGVTTTDANGNFSITFTAPSAAGIVNIVANSDGGYSTPPYSINVMAPIVDFHALSYSIGVYQQITVTGDVKMNGNPEPNMTVELSQSGSLASLGSVTTTTDSSGNFTFSLIANGTAGTEQLYAKANGGVGTVPLTVTGAQIQFAKASYQIGVTQPLTLNGTVTSANSSGTQNPVPGTQTIALTGATVGEFSGSVPGPTDTVTATNGTFSIPYQALTTTGTDTIVGTDTTISASGSTSVTVQPAEVTFHPNSYSGQMNSTVTVTGTVTSLGQSGSQVSITQATSVTLNSPAFGVNTVTVTSSFSGAFSYTVTMPNIPTSNSITATALGGTGTASLATAAPNVVVTVSPSSMPDGTSATITVNVNTGSGSNLSGQSVTLSTSGGGTIVTTSGTTGATGDFTSAFDANNVGASFTITATVDGAYTGTAVISVVPTITGVNFNSTTWAPMVTVNGDGFGTSASNQYLQITDNTEGWQAGNINSGMVISEGSWNNTQVVTSGISNYGNYGVWMMFPNQPVTVNVQNPQTDQTASFNATYPSNAQMPQFVGVTTNNGSLLYGNQATISGYLRLNGGSTPIPNAPIQISVSGLGGGSIVSSTTTNVSGYFSVTYTAPNAAGTATMILTTPDNPAASATVTEHVGYMQFVTFSANPTTVLPHGQTTLSGQLVYNDGTQNGWSGVPLQFTDTSGATTQGTSTGSNGDFTATFTVGGNSGTDTITAICPWDNASASVVITVQSQGFIAVRTSTNLYVSNVNSLSSYTSMLPSGYAVYTNVIADPNVPDEFYYGDGNGVYEYNPVQKTTYEYNGYTQSYFSGGRTNPPPPVGGLMLTGASPPDNISITTNAGVGQPYGTGWAISPDGTGNGWIGSPSGYNSSTTSYPSSWMQENVYDSSNHSWYGYIQQSFQSGNGIYYSPATSVGIAYSIYYDYSNGYVYIGTGSSFEEYYYNSPTGTWVFQTITTGMTPVDIIPDTHNNTLIIVSTNGIYSYSPSTGMNTITTGVSGSLASANSSAFDPTNNTLYLASASSTKTLIAYNLSTGAISTVNFPYPIESIAFTQ